VLPEYDENGAIILGDDVVTREEVREGEGTFIIVSAKAEDKFLFYEYNKDVNHPTISYLIDTEKLYSYKKADIDGLVSEGNISIETACYNYVRDIGAAAAAKGGFTQIVLMA
ncbi:MAG: hypothetical protein OSJ74_12005, partial [Clostridia bacterium]|nr:hypothetical protein [Clostridia bacterium]